MRPYATISPLFWTGATGKRLRSNPDAQRVAFYLMTSPHSHQTGIYYLPKMYLCHEVGIDPEGASKALAWLSNEGFCRYDEDTEWVWVCGMAGWQIGKGLSAGDKRCKGVRQYLSTLPDLPFISDFIRRYADDFHLGAKNDSPLEGAYEGASIEQNREGTDKEQRRNRNRADRASRLPDDFVLTHERRLVAEAERLPAERTFEKFCNYWRSVPGAKGRKLDWDATWRNWCLTERDRNGFRQPEQPVRRSQEFPS